MCSPIALPELRAVIAAGKYSTLPARKDRRAAPVPTPALPLVRRPVWQDPDAAAAQIHGMNVADSQRRSGLNIYLPPPKTMSQGDWRWRELREGGCLHTYLNRMRAGTRRRWEAVGQARAGFQQNPKSDLQLMASIPAYDYFRWLRMDRHFFRDPKNLRALKRDNAHVTSVFV